MVDAVARLHKGGYNELRATLWLFEHGYEVYRNVSQHGPADLIAMKDGVCILIDVKTAFISPNTGNLNHPKLTEAQTTLKVRLLACTKNWIGFSDEYTPPTKK